MCELPISNLLPSFYAGTVLMCRAILHGQFWTTLNGVLRLMFVLETLSLILLMGWRGTLSSHLGGSNFSSNNPAANSSDPVLQLTII